MITVNQPFPNLELDAFFEHDIQKIDLASYRGKWLVLLFYPADFTFVCPTELEEAQSYYEEFQKNDAQIVSVSTDTAYAHLAWHEQSPAIRKITYPMLSDPAGKLCRLCGTYIEDEGLSVRATFIVDPEGKVKSMEMHDNSIGRSIKEILRKLQAAKFISEHAGLVCPASWVPGAATLKPGADLVGKI
ncbi:peroxiredoxin [Candidatus Wirthbacteria bacterium CG2_30_54_11]|uniref:Peroxiredoxin n=1 Tax=Candidatus Wirthbacteria bacterium CG2_30_54_11 TaxID=1817892 RepID=A0A1J5IUP8_9BACT|nr:MAG: peroxiredoxin [Candidatus Wirthbacteria bacterium CG2_30_54_11]